MNRNLLYSKNKQIILVLGMKSVATIILYWKFSNGDIGVTLLATCCSIALFFVKFDHFKKRTKRDWIPFLETEILSLLLIIAPFSIAVIDNWHGTFTDLLFRDGIRFYLVDAFITIIIGRLMWLIGT